MRIYYFGELIADTNKENEERGIVNEEYSKAVSTQSLQSASERPKLGLTIRDFALEAGLPHSQMAGGMS